MTVKNIFSYGRFWDTDNLPVAAKSQANISQLANLLATLMSGSFIQQTAWHERAVKKKSNISEVDISPDKTKTQPTINTVCQIIICKLDVS